MHRERNVVFDPSFFSPDRVQIATCNVIRGPYLEELRQGLDEARPAGFEGQSALVNDYGMRRNRVASRDPEFSGRNGNELRIGKVHEGAVVAYHREVRASGNVLGRLLLVDAGLGYMDQVIVLQRQFDCLVKGQVARSG
jgi:hypothetical protein